MIWAYAFAVTYIGGWAAMFALCRLGVRADERCSVLDDARASLAWPICAYWAAWVVVQMVRSGPLDEAR